MKKLVNFILVAVFLINGFCLFDVSRAENNNNAVNLDNKQESIDKSKKSNNVVDIAMALDDGYLYPTIVSITSMMENKNKDSKYIYHIMHPGEFKEESKRKLKTLENKYDGCRINLINMSNKYKNAKQGHVTTPTYYRLSLPDLLPNLDKIIWLDGDTLVFKDLKEMLDVDMEGYCYRGFLDYKHHVSQLRRFGIKSNDYICAGVMLINLKELRNCNAVEKCNKFINENNDKLSFHDQTTLNVLFYNKIGVLPAKYGLFNSFRDDNGAANYTEKNILSDKKYSKREMKEAFNNPTIVHCVKKPWRNPSVNRGNDWWKYAEKTDYFNEIKEIYAIKDGIYTIKSLLDNNKILGVDLNNVNRSSLNVKLIDKKINGNQLFKVTYTTGGYYEIKSLETDKLLNVSGAKKGDGTNIDEHSKNGTNAQKWFIFNHQKNSWSIISKCNQKCVDVSRAKKEAGTNIQCWSPNGTKAQKFKFEKVS